MTPDQFYAWGTRLMDDLPSYYHEDDFMQQYLMSIGFEFDILDRLTSFFTEPDAQRALASALPTDLEPLITSWFARTVTGKAIEYWEDMLSIPHDDSLTTEQRRAGIIIRMQAVQTPTPEFIRQQVLQYATDVEIVEHFELPSNDINRFSFDIHILEPTGFSDNIQANIDLMIKRIKPSHLHYMIIYSEVTWSLLANMTWATLGDTTWKNLSI